jgi:ribokinase
MLVPSPKPIVAKPIVVVGSINADLVATVEHIPLAGETITGTSFQTHPGGKGANQAVAVARLGYPVKMIGKLGNDANGDMLRSHLQHSRVDTTAIQTTEGSSGTALILVSSAGENCIVVIPGANALVTPADIDANIATVREAGMVLAQLEIPIETVVHLADVCSREAIPLMLDPAPAVTLPRKLLENVTWFTPNETEAAFFLHDLAPSTQAKGPSEIATALKAAALHRIILKLGSRGAFLSSETTEAQIAPFEVKAIDTTAAGDTFNGAFAAAVMMSKTEAESARFAAAAAAVSVTRPGAQPSMPSLAEVNELLGRAEQC